jgi:hypothetical protein
MTVFSNFGAKHPADVLDYSFNWSRWLADDTIISATFAVTPVGPPATADATYFPAYPAFTGAIATMWVSHGVVGASYYLNNTITTAGGRTVEASAILIIIPATD